MSGFRKKLGIFLVVVFACFISVPGWASTISDVKTFVNGLPLGDFNNSNPDMKTSIQKELDAISDTMDQMDQETDAELKAELKQDAIDNLTTLRDKNNGCVTTGNPSYEDSIINCASQRIFYTQLNDLISSLQGS